MEQIKDIVREMRDKWLSTDRDNKTLRNLADRIETAHECELVPNWHMLRDVLLKARTALACCTWEDGTDEKGVQALLGEIDNVLSSTVPNDNE